MPKVLKETEMNSNFFSHMHIQLPEHCPDAEDRGGERSIYSHLFKVNPEKKTLFIITFQGKHIICCWFVYIRFNVLPKNFHSYGEGAYR